MRGKREAVSKSEARKAGRTLGRYSKQRREAGSAASEQLREGSSDAGKAMSSRFWGRRNR